LCIIAQVGNSTNKFMFHEFWTIANGQFTWKTNFQSSQKKANCRAGKNFWKVVKFQNLVAKYFKMRKKNLCGFAKTYYHCFTCVELLLLFCSTIMRKFAIVIYIRVHLQNPTTFSQKILKIFSP
jgi:hypothetical protein